LAPLGVISFSLKSALGEVGMSDVASVMIVVWLVGIFVAILWILLPFAVFGTKPKLDLIIAEARQTNALLKAFGDQQRVLIEQQKLLLTSRSSHVPKLPAPALGTVTGSGA
jgi:hypothetical protein